MRQKFDLNFGWKFSESFDEEMLRTDYDDSAMQTVDVPHTCKEIPYNYFDDSMYEFVSCYRHELDLPETAFDGAHRVILRFEGAANYARVFINGGFAFEHKDGYTPFDGDITSLVAKDKKNVIAVQLDSTERPEMPPFGNVVDYLVYGGIYREVSVLVVPCDFIEDLFVRTPEVSGDKKLIKADITFSHKVKGDMELELIRDGQVISKRTEPVEGEQIRIFWRVNAELWTLDSPVLYTLRVRFGGDCDERRFGFRTCEFRTNGFFLNGEHIKLRGLNRHQSYPYVGNAMPKSAQEADADLLKYRLGCNLVRTSHYPDSVHFLDRCDEIGLLVFTEMPSWQFLGEGEWRDTCLANIRAMVTRDRSHPCVILWGVRVNEGADCDEFYTATNALAHSLDDSRQTGGVRNFPRSHLLEDVYTYNDFSHSGGAIKILPPEIVAGQKAPYMITEFNGHMFPIKSFDCERIRTEAGLRHARVQSAAGTNDRVSGATGWCMADYNTHRDFGSGDRICYHGVTDMFRIPKFSGALYASQQDRTPVLEVSSSMDIGEHPGGIMGQVYIFTNCDYVKVYKNGEYKSTAYPDYAGYPGLRHPPVLPCDYIGDSLTEVEGLDAKTAEELKKALVAAGSCGFKMPPQHYAEVVYAWVHGKLKFKQLYDIIMKYFANWGGVQTEYMFEGYIDGEPVISSVKSSVTSVSLDAVPDKYELTEEATYDVTRIELVARDQNGNRLPFNSAAVRVKVSGAARIIGPAQFSLLGGARAFWIRTVGAEGDISVRIDSDELGSQTLKLTAKKIG